MARRLRGGNNFTHVSYYFPDLNYKNLMEGGDPLQTLRPHLLSGNVHVFAKMANKLRGKVCDRILNSSLDYMFD